ncbi:MAG TPA: hypothetical protein VK009_02665 [Chloroflexota bacterium]|nr:hypothetical protein [Chloroflexota bacterium]
MRDAAVAIGLRLAYPETARALAEARASQWLSPDQLHELSWRRLQETLFRAYETVGFYRRKFEAAGIHPSDIRAPRDLCAVPLTTKDELRQALAGPGPFSQAVDPERVQLLYTTGSTGKPLAIPIDRQGKHERLAITFRDIEWYGHRLGDRNARVWGRGPALALSKRARLVQRLKVGVFGRRMELVSHQYDAPEDAPIGEARLAHWCRELRRYRPKVLDGYVSALCVLARYILDNDIHDLGCTAVATGGEYLSDAARSLISRAFECPVYNRYGSSELGFIAHECGADSNHRLHVNAEGLWLEVLRDGAPALAGETGNIVVTDFTNRAAPLIRYVTGDLGVAPGASDRCACGRGLPLISSVQGRINDVFVLPGGKKLVSHMWHELFHQPFVNQFQVVQHRRDLVQVDVVLAGQPREVEYLALKARVHAALPGCDVTWREVSHVEPGPGGKFRHTRSLLAEAAAL